jgi:periplasmic divalent cation tolerance protein
MTEVKVVLVTAPEDRAGGLGRRLVEERLIACANVLPRMTSVYRWEGEIHEEAEVLLVLKTTAARVPELLRRIPELHPYEVPEALVLGVEEGLPTYLDWVIAETGPPGAGTG